MEDSTSLSCHLKASNAYNKEVFLYGRIYVNDVEDIDGAILKNIFVG